MDTAYEADVLVKAVIPENCLLYTSIGDGKIFVYDVAQVVKVRTGEEGIEALL